MKHNAKPVSIQKCILSLNKLLSQVEARNVENSELIREAQDKLMEITEAQRKHVKSRQYMNKLLKGCKC